jgi:diaminohydroxyphosphoribosylaminopyrimidine deaminase/5-amino-6-(5-phosphoribosylamino)uracil reductase
VGAGTILADDPSLNVRLGKRTRTNCVLIFGAVNQLNRYKVVKANGVDNIVVVLSTRPLKVQLEELYREHQVCEIFLEGGPRLAGAFLEEGLVDKASILYGKGFLGGSGRYSIGEAWALKSPEESVMFQPQSAQKLGAADVLIEGFFHVYRTHTK